jgi:hypothetical protein
MSQTFGLCRCFIKKKGEKMSEKKREDVVTWNGYVPGKTAGYTPPRSSGDTKNVQLPKGGSGESGSPVKSSGAGNANGESKK